MEPSSIVSSPKTPSNRRFYKTGSPRFLWLEQTPRSEGYHYRHKIFVESPASSEDLTFPSPSGWVEETPPHSVSSVERTTPLKELVQHKSPDDSNSANLVIPEKKFYNRTNQRKSLLPLFLKDEIIEKNKIRAKIEERDRERQSKRKRSKSLDTRVRKKYTKLDINLRHGVKKAKPKKANSSKKNNEPQVVNNPPGMISEEKTKVDSVKKDILPHESKPKVSEKKISVNVNKMVRMNLQCGEIKFTKHALSPRKPRKKIEPGDDLDVPKTDGWIKNKVNNIISTLEEDNCEGELELVGRSLEGSNLNDSASNLSDAFCELGMKEIRHSARPAEIDQPVESHELFTHESYDKENENNQESNEVEMETINNDIQLKKNAQDFHSLDDSELAQRKLYPVFYKTVQNKIKPNMSANPKSLKDGLRFHNNLDIQTDDGMEQMIIDAGQKSLGPSICSECGFFYQKGDRSEEKMHEMYHGSSKPVIKHMGWKWERVALTLPDGRVIRVCPGDPKLWWNKVEAVLEKANDDLGISFTSKIPKDAQAYMYVGDGHILGCVIAEPIRVAYRMLGSEMKELEKTYIPGDDKESELPKMPSFCSDTPVRGSRCGINRMWTCASERRKGIATKILDAIRVTFAYGHILKLDEIAFSDPTPMGMAFAQKYTNNSNFLVYKISKD